MNGIVWQENQIGQLNTFFDQLFGCNIVVFISHQILFHDFSEFVTFLQFRPKCHFVNFDGNLRKIAAIIRKTLLPDI